MGNAPKISVIMPSYNHERFIGAAIESVLAQSFEDFELVIVDDKSTDGSVEVIRAYTDPRIRLFVSQVNVGGTVAINRCISESRGEYIAILHSDDIFMPGKLEKQLAYLEENPQVPAVLSTALLIDEEGNQFTDRSHYFYDLFTHTNRTRHEWLNHFFYKGNCLCHPSLLIRYECYDEFGLYAEHTAQLADLCLWVKICLTYNIHIIQEGLIGYRVLSGDMNASGGRKEVILRDFFEKLEILKNYLEIASLDEFYKIFPDARTEGTEVKDEDLIPFLVAMEAWKVPHKTHKMFAIETFYDIFKDGDIARKISDATGFTSRDLIKLAGEFDIMNIGSEWVETSLLVDNGNGYDTGSTQKQTTRITLEDFSISFDLSSYDTVRAVRWDPVKRLFCDIMLNAVTYIDASGIERSLEPSLLTSNAASTVNSTYEFRTAYPSIYLPIHGDIKRVTIYGSCTAIAMEDAVSELDGKLAVKSVLADDLFGELASLKHTIADRETEIKKLTDSVSWKLTGPLRSGLDILFNLRRKFSTFNFIFTMLFRISLKVILTITKDPLGALRLMKIENIKSFFGQLGRSEFEGLNAKLGLISDVDGPIMFCEYAHMVTASSIEVVGWAISSHGLSGVEVYLDDRPVGEASMEYRRTDIEALYPHIKVSGNSGFFLVASLNTDLDIGQHTIKVRAVDGRGNSREVAIRIDFQDPYKEHINSTEPGPGMLSWYREKADALSYSPCFRPAISFAPDEETALLATLDSIKAQTWVKWRLLLFHSGELSYSLIQELKPLTDQKSVVIYPASERDKSLSSVRGDLFSFMHPGDLLRPDAFFRVAMKFNLESRLELVYSDDDIFKDGVRCAPFFKPDWSPELLLSINYIGRAFYMKRALFKKSAPDSIDDGSCWLYDLLLRAAEQSDSIGRVAGVLFSNATGSRGTGKGGIKAIEDALSRRDITGNVSLGEESGIYRIKRSLGSSAPLVSIIILTPYMNPEKNLRSCIRSIVEKSSYASIEIVIVDNSKGKMPVEEISSLLGERVLFKRIEYDGEFNFSYMNNMAAKEALGDYLLFLNDDTEVISEDWIESMLVHVARPDVGIVGAKLLYEDGTIQHAGVFLVDHGCYSRHAFRFAPDEGGVCHGLLFTERNVSAVTFACVMVSKKNFELVGGLEEELRVECNDVDFCLRLTRAGLRVVWTPHAVLFHKELGSRAGMKITDDQPFQWNRWRELIEFGDPLYNSNLTLDSDNLTLNQRPVVLSSLEPDSGSKSSYHFHGSAIKDPLSVKEILIVNLSSAADSILCIPALRRVKARFPRARITFLTTSLLIDYHKKIAIADEFICVNFKEPTLPQGPYLSGCEDVRPLEEALVGREFHLAFDFSASPEPVDFLRLVQARYYSAYYFDKSNEWLSSALVAIKPFDERAGLACKAHISRELLFLVDYTAGVKTDGELRLNLHTPKMPLDILTDAIVELPSGTEFVVGFHVGAASKIEMWPREHIARLSDLLISRRSARVLLLGGSEDKGMIDEIVEMISSKALVFTMSRDLSHEDLVATASHCDIFIGHDFWPLHLASITGNSTLGLFSGVVLPSVRHPLGPDSLVISTAIHCSPCYKSLSTECPFQVRCMTRLWPEKVYEAVVELLLLTRERSA